MTTPDLLGQILSAQPPQAYALLVRNNLAKLEVLVGDVVDTATLSQIPLHDEHGQPRQVLTIVPYHQVTERGFDAIDDKAPLRSLVVTQRQNIDLADAIDRLPAQLPPITGEGFTIADEEYTNIVRDVIDNEIGRGEGANFVIRRDYIAQADASGPALALALLRRLLEREHGAYWTFTVVTDGVILAGASPERHISVEDKIATMNPISGTYRHGPNGVDPHEFSQFLMDTKEVEELFMVVDEELKMMSEVCADGGLVLGPYLKQMSRVTHTEYLLRGHTSLDVRDVLRETMFAPTVTGSPMQNACAVIARHEKTGRGYYSGVIALMTPQADGGFELDAPIIIRTAQISNTGRITVSAGATLVRHSNPVGEVAETAGKAAGLLSALGLEAAYGAGFGAGQDLPRDEWTSSASRTVPSPAHTRAAKTAAEQQDLADDEAIQHALAARNAMLAPFWLTEQNQRREKLRGYRAVVVDAEDRFTTMLAHQLRHLGMDVDVVNWKNVPESGQVTTTDGTPPNLVVAGPGPGDPADQTNPRIQRLTQVVTHALNTGQPFVAVCLSHQIVSQHFGLDIVRLDHPRQGVQLTVDYFGTPARIGFYNTFTARISSPETDQNEATSPTQQLATHKNLKIAADPDTGDVYALRGDNFATLQGHAESILSIDGIDILDMMVSHALGVSTTTPPHHQ